jgi:hypothetical protein
MVLIASLSTSITSIALVNHRDHAMLKLFCFVNQIDFESVVAPVVHGPCYLLVYSTLLLFYHIAAFIEWRMNETVVGT